MWDTTARVPFGEALLRDRSDDEGRSRLLALITACPGITVDELSALGLPGLFADLRSFHRDGLIETQPSPPRFFERATRVCPAPGSDAGGGAGADRG